MMNERPKECVNHGCRNVFYVIKGKQACIEKRRGVMNKGDEDEGLYGVAV